MCKIDDNKYAGFSFIAPGDGGKREKKNSKGFSMDFFGDRVESVFKLGRNFTNWRSESCFHPLLCVVGKWSCYNTEKNYWGVQPRSANLTKKVGC